MAGGRDDEMPTPNLSAGPGKAINHTGTAASSRQIQTSNLPTPRSTSSFWHTQPSTLLYDHRSTPEVPWQTDIAIIGTGICGASATTQLILRTKDAKKQPHITLLDARQVCWGATGRNGGHCQPILYDRPVDASRFEILNWKTLKQLIADEQIECDYNAQPSVHAFYNAKALADAENGVRMVKNAAPDLADLIRVVRDADELRRLRLSDGAVGAIVTSTASRLWPYKLVTALLEPLVRDKRVNLQTNTPVTSITSSGPHTQHKWLLSTPRGTIRARNVLLATNGYTSHLLPGFSDLIVPCRGQMSALIPPSSGGGEDGYAPRIDSSFAFVAVRKETADDTEYLHQRPPTSVPHVPGKAHLMLGGAADVGAIPDLGSSDDSFIDEDVARYLRRALPRTLTEMSAGGQEELQATHEWTGVMGYSRDHMPFIGGVPPSLLPSTTSSTPESHDTGSEISGLWIAAGFSGHGMPNAFLSGRAVADMIVASDPGTGSGSGSGSETDASLDEIYEQAVSGPWALPRRYLSTEHRVQRARKELMDLLEAQMDENMQEAQRRLVKYTFGEKSRVVRGGDSRL